MSQSAKPLILISNDDGIAAPGLQALAKVMQPHGEVWVIAPDGERSAVSHGISLGSPLWIEALGERRFQVSGTPADTVYAAISELLPRPPALVLSGINKGHNLGDDTQYSGTLAAAAEGATLGFAALAVSLGNGGSLEACATLAAKVALQILQRGIPPRTFLSLNVPKGWQPGMLLRIAPIGGPRYHKNLVKRVDPRGQPYYWLGGHRLEDNPHGMTDSDCCARAEATLTPIKLDRTAYELMTELETWL